MRVELGEVEDVADEPLEPVGLHGDHVERGVRASRVLDDALAQRVDVAADRRQRRPQLVRDRHQEVALELLRLGQPRVISRKRVGEMADLVASARLRDLDVVVAVGDLVGRRREREHRVA